MEQKKIKFLLLTSVITFVGCVLSGCTEEVFEEITSNRITFSIDDQGFNESKVDTRGAKVSSVTSFGVSASVYGASSTYTSAGCGSYFYKESVSSGTPTRFYWPTADYKISFFGYYPYNNAAFTVQSAASATGAPTYSYTVPSAIANQVDIMTGQDLNHLGGGTTPVSLTMKHRCSAICFSVTNSRSSAITLNSISIEGVKYSGTLNEETWTLTNAVNSSSSNPFILSYGGSIAASATVNVTGTTNIFLMLPQTIPAGAKLKVVIDGEDPLYADLTGSWIAGRQYNYTLDVQNSTIIIVDEDSEIEDWITTIDLSMVDNAGNARGTMTTANCYLVHAAGDYKLPLVYGNAIKNGMVNTAAFYPGTVLSGTSRFINHDDDGITGPWITKNGSGVNSGMGLTAAYAELLWQDANGLISAISVDGNYLKFTVGSFNPGNALIAVKDGSGTILWSWHIWATEDDLSNISVVDYGTHKYTISPVNLGWVPTGGGGKQGYCTYYQWGRKDPFIPCNGRTNINKTVYNISGATVTGITYQASTTATISENIKNPTIFYYDSNTYGPVSTAYRNMWDAKNSNTGNVSKATIKTIYDPCPPGFCVPTSNLFHAVAYNGTNRIGNFDQTNWGATDNWISTGNQTWYPSLGCRMPDSGNLNWVNSASGRYWSATPYDANKTIYLLFDINYFYYDKAEKAYGNLVRPVVEE